jgi:ribosome maturation factor RimP
MALDLEGIRGIAARVAASYGLEIWDVELRGTGGKSRMLRVFIDRPRQVGAQPGGGVAQSGLPAAAGKPGQEAGTPAVGGVTHEDCANVSRELGTILDVEDAVPGGTYLLEVSSPGLDRKLAKAADFERFVGSRVKLMTREPIVLASGGGDRHFEGRLLSAGEGKLVLSLEEKKEKGKGKKKRGRDARETAGETPALRIEIDLSNVERANLVPEI